MGYMNICGHRSNAALDLTWIWSNMLLLTIFSAFRMWQHFTEKQQINRELVWSFHRFFDSLRLFSLRKSVRAIRRDLYAFIHGLAFFSSSTSASTSFSEFESTAYCLVSALLILSHHFHLSKLIWNALLFWFFFLQSFQYFHILSVSFHLCV